MAECSQPDNETIWCGLSAEWEQSWRTFTSASCSIFFFVPGVFCVVFTREFVYLNIEYFLFSVDEFIVGDTLVIVYFARVSISWEIHIDLLNFKFGNYIWYCVIWNVNLCGSLREFLKQRKSANVYLGKSNFYV